MQQAHRTRPVRLRSTPHLLTPLIWPGRTPARIGSKRRQVQVAVLAPRADHVILWVWRWHTDDHKRGGETMAKHIFVTGGVVSSLGKGLTCASIGMLLEQRGLRVRLQKFDPYINVDPGTMSPYQHGEVYVLDDGSETDLDLGHYERFTHASLTRDSNYTTGQIYQSVINKEREGKHYEVRTVQVIPHVTDEIKAAILRLAADDVDVVITEIGGTVGDIEGLPFLEAIRQFALDVG